MKLTIKKGFYPNKSAYWRLSGTLPNKERVRQNFASEAEAIKERNRLVAQYHGGVVTADQQREGDKAILKLRGSRPETKDKSLDFVVDWFITYYRDTSKVETLEVWADRFYKSKEEEQGREKKTLSELKRYLDDLKLAFGKVKPTDISAEQLRVYFANRTCPAHRFKVTRGLFSYLSNTSKKSIPLPNPPLNVDENPFRYLVAPSPKKKSKTQIMTVREVLAILREAKKQDCLPWFVWGIYTGMRPEAEMLPFWKNPDYGWSCVDLERGTIMIDKTLEKVGTRTREIEIQPNLRKWIEHFKANKTPMLPPNLKRKFLSVKKAALPEEKAMNSDVMRHTFISHLWKIKPMKEVCFQCATSEDKIRENYFRFVSEQATKLFWRITPSKLELLKEL